MALYPGKFSKEHGKYPPFLRKQEWRGWVYSLDTRRVFAQTAAREWRMGGAEATDMKGGAPEQQT